MRFDIVHAALANIEEYGLHIQAVGPSEEAPNGFVYTVGMTKHGFPELICFGLHPQTIYPFMNKVYSELKNGERNKALKRDDDSFNFGTYFDKVDPELLEDYATLVFELFGNGQNKPTFRQVVFPDKFGFYPYEVQCDTKFKTLQPYFGTRRRRDPDQESALGLN